MARILALPLTLLLGAAFILLLVGLLAVIDLPLCSDPGPIAGDCIEGTGGERIAGLALGFAAVASAGLGAWFGSRFLRAGTGGGRFAAAAVATLALALAALALLPVSF